MTELLAGWLALEELLNVANRVDGPANAGVEAEQLQQPQLSAPLLLPTRQPAQSLSLSLFR